MRAKTASSNVIGLAPVSLPAVSAWLVHSSRLQTVWLSPSTDLVWQIDYMVEIRHRESLSVNGRRLTATDWSSHTVLERKAGQIEWQKALAERNNDTTREGNALVAVAKAAAAGPAIRGNAWISSRSSLPFLIPIIALKARRRRGGSGMLLLCSRC